MIIYYNDVIDCDVMIHDVLPGGYGTVAISTRAGEGVILSVCVNIPQNYVEQYFAGKSVNNEDIVCLVHGASDVR